MFDLTERNVGTDAPVGIGIAKPERIPGKLEHSGLKKPEGTGLKKPEGMKLTPLIVTHALPADTPLIVAHARCGTTRTRPATSPRLARRRSRTWASTTSIST